MAKQWYVVHTYSGFENKVAEAIRQRAKIFGQEEQISQVVIPTEEVVEVRKGQKRITPQKFFPGYVLVEMDMTDDSWHLVKSTPKVTGFVGSGVRPAPLPQEEVETILRQTRVVAEVIAAGSATGAVIAIDDFGEGMDSDTARHLASMLCKESAQAWLSTRRPSVAQAFSPGEIIRLTRMADGRRQLHQLTPPTTRAERVAARHLNIQVLPAMTSRSVVIVEGPHDRAALDALAERIQRREGVPLPAARGVALIDAAAADRSGGSSGVVRLAGLAKAFGFHTVAVISGKVAGGSCHGVSRVSSHGSKRS